MKKIYAVAALMFAAISGAKAQALPIVDLEALVIIDNMKPIVPITGKGISWRAALDNTVNPFDSIPAAALVTIAPNGGTLIEGDKIFWATPTSYLENGSLWGYVRSLQTAEEINADPTLLTPVSVDSRLIGTDSIRTLLNIDSFEAGANAFASLLVPRAQLVTGNVYGFYLYCTEQPTTSGGEDYTFRDTVRGNNFAYVPVIWNSTTSSIGKFSTQYESMDVFPNPATGVIKYNAEVKKASPYQTVRIIDLVGRAVFTENKGATAAGKLNGQIDITALAAGTYTIQVITQYGVSSTKFVKN